MHIWTSNTINVNNKDIHYTCTGKSQKNPLVLVHGFSDNGLCWTRTAKRLQDEYDIIMPDSDGHGLSARVEPGDDIDNASDLAELIKALKLDHPIIAGHSMGAASASELVARFPELPRALILEDPPWGFHRPPDVKPSGSQVSPVFEWATTLKGKTVDELIIEYSPQYPSWDTDVLRTWCLGKTQLDQNFLTAKYLFQMDWIEIVESIECPTLLIIADQPGGIVCDSTAKQATSLNSSISHQHVSGTGHHIRFENYEDYFKAFTDFLQRV